MAGIDHERGPVETTVRPGVDHRVLLGVASGHPAFLIAGVEDPEPVGGSEGHG